MKSDARPRPEQECGVRSGILWDLAAVYPSGAVWSDKMPPAVLFNGPVVDVTASREEALNHRPAPVPADPPRTPLAAFEDLFMADDRHPPQRVMPTLRITDYARSKQFYVDDLGFQIDWEHRFEAGFPVFVQVSRDGLAFFLTEHTGDCPVGGLIHLYVPDVDAWFSEFQRKGVRVHEPPNEGLPGLRSMTVLDPDGNKLHICTRLPDWRRE